MSLFIEHADVGQPFLKSLMPGSERNSTTGLDASAIQKAAIRSVLQ
jgi:hypothetical protein